MEYIEVSGKTTEEAIEKASIDLGIPSYDLDIQVISDGSAGFLGFGSKPAIIKVRKKEDIEADKEKEEEAERKAKTARAGKKKKKKENRGESAAGDALREKTGEKRAKKKASHAEDTHKEYTPKPVPVRTPEEIEAFTAEAKDFLSGLFAAMGLDVKITPEYNAEEGSLEINFEGADMGTLIGKRGQTLDSLQYITSLVVNKNIKEYVRVKLDTENYRGRRKETLENLAKNIASKVKKTRKTVVLEPMNPYERRIIHSALQNTAGVETFSEGNEPYRHIVVKPVKNN